MSNLSICLAARQAARFPPFLHLTTSKTQHFCDTFSIFELDNVKNETVLRDFRHFRSGQHQKWNKSARPPSKMESCMHTDGIVPMRFVIFPVHLSKLLRLPRKSEARSYEVLHLSRKIILANLKMSCSKMQPLSGNERPDLLTSPMNMSLVLRLPRDMHLRRSSSNGPRLPTFLKLPQNHHVLLTFDKVHNPLRLPRETTSERPKLVWTMCFYQCWMACPPSRSLVSPCLPLTPHMCACVGWCVRFPKVLSPLVSHCPPLSPLVSIVSPHVCLCSVGCYARLPEVLPPLVSHCPPLPPIISPHVCLCWMVCPPSRGLVGSCLPLSPIVSPHV